MRFSVLLLVWLPAASVFAQYTTTAPSGTTSNPNPIVNLASQFFEHDYFNVFAYASGAYDSSSPVVQNNQTSNSGGFGYGVGGGINAFHSFRHGTFSLDYSGGYSNYQSSFFASGSNQSLGVGFTQRLTRRWTLSVNGAAGIWLYGAGTSFPAQPTALPNSVTNPMGTVIANPFSPETRFASAGVNVAYQQTRRLSYVLGGNFGLTRYSYPGAIGTTGGGASASVVYQVRPRTTLAGSYSYSHFVYQQNVGQASVNGVAVTATHAFPSHWTVSLSGGISRSNASGIITVPVNFLVGTGSSQQAIPGFVLGHYDQSTNIPTYSGSVSRSFRHSSLVFSAGEGILGGGNGYYLTSRQAFINGYYSRTIQRRSNISFGGAYYRLSSLANTISSTYSTESFSANYGTMLMRYLGTFVRYDFVRYGSLSGTSGVHDNRISFGVNFSSKGIPMTLF